MARPTTQPAEVRCRGVVELGVSFTAAVIARGTRERGLSPHRPKNRPALRQQHRLRRPRQTTSKRPCWMREVLCDRRLVDEPATGPEDPSNLTQRRACARDPAADVIARAEIDDQIERAVVEGKLADVPLEHGHVQRGRAHLPACDRDQRGVDVYAYETRRPEPLGEHRQRNPAPAANLEHPSADGGSQGPKKHGNLDAPLEAIPRFHVAEGFVLG